VGYVGVAGVGGKSTHPIHPRAKFWRGGRMKNYMPLKNHFVH
jgi:hypothetical protein